MLAGETSRDPGGSLSLSFLSLHSLNPNWTDSTYYYSQHQATRPQILELTRSLASRFILLCLQFGHSRRNPPTVIHINSQIIPDDMRMVVPVVWIFSFISSSTSTLFGIRPLLITYHPFWSTQNDLHSHLIIVYQFQSFIATFSSTLSFPPPSSVALLPETASGHYYFPDQSGLEQPRRVEKRDTTSGHLLGKAQKIGICINRHRWTPIQVAALVYTPKLPPPKRYHISSASGQTSTILPVVLPLKLTAQGKIFVLIYLS